MTIPRPALFALASLAVLAIGVGAFFALRPAAKTAPIVKAQAMHRPAQPLPLKIAAAPKAAPVSHTPTAFEREQAMSHAQLLKRWEPFMLEASKRFGVPLAWIRAVMQAESGGRTMLAENLPITSNEGAMGLMQLMPETYAEMRAAYRLGSDPYDPHDNILAGAAYLRILNAKYGYPQMFAAYNDGPGNLEARMIAGGLLPTETRDYVSGITARLEGRIVTGGRGGLKFTRPDGTPVYIDPGSVMFVRGAFPGEYGPGVQSVITVGRTRQAVREPLAQTRAILRAHGGGFMSASRRLAIPPSP